MPEHAHPNPDVGGYVLGVLEPEEAAAFEALLGGCDQCRHEVAELAGLADLLGQAAPPLDVPPDLAARTFAAVDAAAATTAPVDRKAARPARQPRMLPLRRVLAVAAAVVVVGSGVVVVREVRQPTAAEAEVVVLEAPAGHSGRAVAHVRTTATGGVIDMEVEGLAPPPPGSFFECWLVSAQGDTVDHPNRVSVGTFTVDARGNATVHWDFKADTTMFPRMGVTIEPADGNPAQTTDKVLAATRLL